MLVAYQMGEAPLSKVTSKDVLTLNAHPNTKERLVTVPKILENVTSVNIESTKRTQGATHTEEIELLSDLKIVDPTLKDENGNTPISLALEFDPGEEMRGYSRRIGTAAKMAGIPIVKWTDGSKDTGGRMYIQRLDPADYKLDEKGKAVRILKSSEHDIVAA